MSKFNKIYLALFSLFFLACGQVVEYGDPSESPTKAKIADINEDFPAFMDDTVRLKGVFLEKGKTLHLMSKPDITIPIFPIGFEISDSLFRTDIDIEGIVFYHEEFCGPAIAMYYLKGRFPRKLRENP